VPENDPEEEHDGQGNGVEDTQKEVPCPRNKRKENYNGKSTHQCKKRKSFKEVATQALTEDDPGENRRSSKGSDKQSISACSAETRGDTHVHA
jgi:hypothetical protein